MLASSVRRTFAAILTALPASVAAQATIKVGFPMILSGPGALFGVYRPDQFWLEAPVTGGAAQP